MRGRDKDIARKGKVGARVCVSVGVCVSLCICVRDRKRWGERRETSREKRKER